MNNNFFSTDRLIEFGINLTIAQQMINSMNFAIQNMIIPGTIKSIPLSCKMWYIAIENKPIGPLSENELIKILLNNEVSKNTLVWTIGMANWKPIEQVPEVLKIIALLPPSL